MMSPAEHYEAAMRVMAEHDRLAREVHVRVGRSMSVEQSNEAAHWVIAHALMGLLSERLDPEMVGVVEVQLPD